MSSRSPFRFTVREHLLENVEPNFAVVQRVTKVAAFIYPRRWNPAQGQIEEALDLVVTFPRAGVGENGYVRLACELVFGEHRLPIVTAVPNRDEIEFHVRVGLDGLQPAAALQL